MLRSRFAEVELAKLRLLIHTHDTFKGEAKRGVAIRHPESHASLARDFLADFCDDEQLLTMVQFMTSPRALLKQGEVAPRIRHVWRSSGRRSATGTCFLVS